MNFEEQLSTAMRASVERVPPPVPELVAGGLQRGRRLRRRQRVWRGLAAAAVVTLVVGAGAVATVQLRGGSTTTTVPADGVAGCRSVVQTGVLPVWARGGFSDPAPRIAHVMGAKGDIVAILFAQPLSAPPAHDHNNKILWVSRVPQDTPGPLTIDARLAGSSTRVRRAVDGGPGPSIIDLPRAGCWHLDLRWGSNTDSLDVVYRTGH
ncbi:MAG: hypothetical protein ACXV3V_12960 [Actinomycetes bacterium]